MRDPADIHFFEQMQARALDIARIVVAYRQELVDGGIEPAEAWARAQILERRLWDNELMPFVWEAFDDPESFDP